MSPFTVLTAFSILTIAGQILIPIFCVLYILKRGVTTSFLENRGLLLMLIVALLATGGSLFFSDIAGWTPCKLCWLQRIFMYPQVLLLSLAIWMKDRGVARYILALSLIGLFIAVLHYGEQVSAALYPASIDPLKPCDATGVSCAKTPSFGFGYITIPLMAATAFLLNIAGSLFVMRSYKERS